MVRKSVGELKRKALRSPHVPFLSDLPRFIRLLLQNGTTMPADLLTLPLPTEPLAASSFPVERLMPATSDDRAELAALYLASYPPEIGADSLVTAEQEIDNTWAGEFGVLRPDASFIALSDQGQPIGAILVVERSVWDQNVDGPFIIDLFVHPNGRGQGAGKALVLAAIHACIATGDERVSLRVGEGTSHAAYNLYRALHFKPHEAS